MAASTESAGKQSNGRSGGAAPPAGNPSNDSNSNAAAGGNPGPGAQALGHDLSLSNQWSAEEQAILEEGLAKYASEQILVRYAKIAKQLLQEKTVRDVAMRCRWMMKKESRKRRKEDIARKSEEEKDRVTGPSPKPPAHLAARPSAPPYALSMLHIENDDEISYTAIGGVTGQLLERNTHVFNQISTNLHNYQIQGNFSLFCHTRDNILKILNDMNDMLEIMKEMPPLPVKVNEELANSILPRTTMPMQT